MLIAVKDDMEKIKTKGNTLRNVMPLRIHRDPSPRGLEPELSSYGGREFNSRQTIQPQLTEDSNTYQISKPSNLSHYK